jgi:hypothetical protein
MTMYIVSVNHVPHQVLVKGWERTKLEFHGANKWISGRGFFFKSNLAFLWMCMSTNIFWMEKFAHTCTGVCLYMSLCSWKVCVCVCGWWKVCVCVWVCAYICIQICAVVKFACGCGCVYVFVRCLGCWAFYMAYAVCIMGLLLRAYHENDRRAHFMCVLMKVFLVCVCVCMCT